jgi:flagellar basal-body rod modification protein FlgD
VNSVETYKGLGVSTSDTVAPKKKSLGQDQFLKLMTTQMTHQDPTKPMQNGEFLSQMAQFGTVSGIQDLQQSFKDFAASIGSDQALQAAKLKALLSFRPALPM